MRTGGLSRSSAILGSLSVISPTGISRLLRLLQLLLRDSLRISLTGALVPSSAPSPSASLPSVSPRWKSFLLFCLLMLSPERTARSGPGATRPAWLGELVAVPLTDSTDSSRERLGGKDIRRFSLSPSTKRASCLGWRPRRGGVISVTVVADARDEEDGSGLARDGELE